MKKRKQKRKLKGSFIPPIYVPTMFGARLNINRWNQLWRWDTLENCALKREDK